MHSIYHTRIVRRTYALLNRATRTAFLLKFSDITIRRCLRSTERNTYMQPAPSTDITENCLLSKIENELLITLRELKETILATKSVSVSQQLVHIVLKTLGFSRKTGVLVHPRPASTEIATTTKFQERFYRYEAAARWFFFQSMRSVSDENFGACMGIRGAVAR
jgi:transposase